MHIHELVHVHVCIITRSTCRSKMYVCYTNKRPCRLYTCRSIHDARLPPHTEPPACCAWGSHIGQLTYETYVQQQQHGIAGAPPLLACLLAAALLALPSCLNSKISKSKIATSRPRGRADTCRPFHYLTPFAASACRIFDCDRFVCDRSPNKRSKGFGF